MLVAESGIVVELGMAKLAVGSNNEVIGLTEGGEMGVVWLTD
jgi:hypothetical protein